MPTEDSDYRSFFISDGRHVGDYEEVYRLSEDPWNHLSEHHELNGDRSLALAWMERLKSDYDVSRVVEYGSGLGQVTNRLTRSGLTVTGVEVSRTAVDRARVNFPAAHFVVGDIADSALLGLLDPEVIFMSHVTWSCLEVLNEVLQNFRDFAASAAHDVFLVHLVALYPPGVQKYGVDFFTTHEEVLRYFGLSYVETAALTRESHGEVTQKSMASAFLARLN